MDSKHNQATEYATQFFDFVPQCFVDELNQSCQELVMDALGVIKTKIAGKYDGKLDPAVMEASMQKVEDKYSEEFDKIFEKVGKFTTENILRVPAHVLLPEDEVWDTERPGSISAKSANVDVELEALRNKIKTANYKKTVLRESLKDMEAICVKQEAKIKADDELFKQYNVGDWRHIVDLMEQDKASLTKNLNILEKLTKSERDNEANEYKYILDKQKRVKIAKYCESYLDNLQQEIIKEEGDR